MVKKKDLYCYSFPQWTMPYFLLLTSVVGRPSPSTIGVLLVSQGHYHLYSLSDGISTGSNGWKNGRHWTKATTSRISWEWETMTGCPLPSPIAHANFVTLNSQTSSSPTLSDARILGCGERVSHWKLGGSVEYVVGGGTCLSNPHKKPRSQNADRTMMCWRRLQSH